jgi:hypothetical protein
MHEIMALRSTLIQAYNAFIVDLVAAVLKDSNHWRSNHENDTFKA